jgi:hypothetical protein
MIDPHLRGPRFSQPGLTSPIDSACLRPGRLADESFVDLDRLPEVRSSEREGLGSRLSLDDLAEADLCDLSRRPSYAGAATTAQSARAWAYARSVLTRGEQAATTPAERAQLTYAMCAPSPDGHALRQRSWGRRMAAYIRGRQGWLFGAPDPYATRFVVVTQEPYAYMSTPDGRAHALSGAVYSHFDDARHAAATCLAPSDGNPHAPPGAWIVRMVGPKKQLAEAIRDNAYPCALADVAVRIAADGSELGVICPFTAANPRAAYAPRPGEAIVDASVKSRPLTGKDKRQLVYRSVGVSLGVPLAIYLGVRYGTPWGAGQYATTREHLFNAGLYVWYARTLEAAGRLYAKIAAKKHLHPNHDNTWALLAQLGTPERRESSLFVLREQLTGWHAAARGVPRAMRQDYRQAIDRLLNPSASARARSAQATDVLRRAPLDTYGRQVTGLRGWLRGVPAPLRQHYGAAVQRLRTNDHDHQAWAVLGTAPLVLLARTNVGWRGAIRVIAAERRHRYAQALDSLCQRPTDEQALQALGRIPLDDCEHHFTGWLAAARGIHITDRHHYRLAIETLRRNPRDAGSLQVLLTAPYKLLTPTTPMGRVQELFRYLTLGCNQADYARLFTNLFLDPAFNQWQWPLTGAAGQNLWVSNASDAFYAQSYAAGFASTATRRQLDWKADKNPESNRKPRTYQSNAHRPRAVRWLIGLGASQDVTHDGRSSRNGTSDRPQPVIKPPLAYRWEQYSAWGDTVAALCFLLADAVWLGWAVRNGEGGHVAVQTGKVLADWGMYVGARRGYVDQYRANRLLGRIVYRSGVSNRINEPVGVARVRPTAPEHARIRRGVPALILAAAAMTPRVALSAIALSPDDLDRQQPTHVAGAPAPGSSAATWTMTALAAPSPAETPDRNIKRIRL